VTAGPDGGSLPRDRTSVTHAARDLVLGAVQRRTPAGASVVIEGPPGIGKTFLARDILASVGPGEAKVRQLTGGRQGRNDPFTAARQLLGGAAPDGDPGDAAFDHVDELCADGPVVIFADDAHRFDGASLTLLRRLVWASRSLPLVMLISTRPFPASDQLAMLIQQVQLRLALPPMDRMMVERLVLDTEGRWPGPRLRRILELAAGNPLFAAELVRAYRVAGALAELGPDSIEARYELNLQATGIEDMIRAHLGQLDQPTRDVLAAMAVWGTEIGAGDLAALRPGPPDVLAEPLDRAIASGLARRDPAGTAGFAHDLFREVTYGEVPEARRRELHHRAARVLQAAGYRPALVTEHLLRAAGTNPDQSVVTALHDAVAATRVLAPEVTADLLEDAAELSGPDVAGPLLPDRVEALFLAGRGPAAEALARENIAAVTDTAVAAKLQTFLIRSLINRAETTAALAAIDRTTAITGLPGPARRQLESVRSWLLALAGRTPPVAEQDEMLARFTAAGDPSARASALATMAFTAFQAGRPGPALELMREREKLVAGPADFRSRSSALFLPATFELAYSGPHAAQAAVDRARRLSAERHAEWLDPFLGFVAGGIAFAAGDWDGAVAELDSALERAEETGTGWISIPIGLRSYIDAHRGRTGPARARLESFRHRRLPLQFGQDNPGLAELAVLEAGGAAREAATLARALWSAAAGRPDRWAAEIAPDVARVAVTGMDRRFADQLRDDVAAICPARVSQLVNGMLTADPAEISAVVTELAAEGRLTAAAFAGEELACAAAAAGDRDRASAALEAALAGYQRFGAVPDRDRALGRLRALGIRRGSRAAHRGADSGWASLTATEVRIAGLVREGLTNREIGTRLFISPRTAQTHISHILQKTGLRSRVEIARGAGAEIS
jgi:DNA-binding CsgD family transcriptional regulator